MDQLLQTRFTSHIPCLADQHRCPPNFPWNKLWELAQIPLSVSSFIASHKINLQVTSILLSIIRMYHPLLSSSSVQFSLSSWGIRALTIAFFLILDLILLIHRLVQLCTHLLEGLDGCAGLVVCHSLPCTEFFHGSPSPVTAFPKARSVRSFESYEKFLAEGILWEMLYWSHILHIHKACQHIQHSDNSSSLKN